MIMGITVFAAFATPSTDPLTMLALAGPDLGPLLRAPSVFSPAQRPAQAPPRRRRAPADDEASDLDLTPEDIGEVETVSAQPRPARAVGHGPGQRLRRRDLTKPGDLVGSGP